MTDKADFLVDDDFHIVAALAYIGEKSRGISPSRGIYRLGLLTNMIFTLYFEVSPGISWDPTRWGEVFLEGVGYGLPLSNLYFLLLNIFQNHRTKYTTN